MPVVQEVPVHYPESDGKPMAETDTHRNLIMQMIEQLQRAFPEAYVSGNICLYYEQGNPKKMISPDSLLCLGQPPQIKRVYFAWEPDAQLNLVVEFSSWSTHREDHNKKKRIYQNILHVPYYVIYDPHAIYLNVFALKDGQYEALQADESQAWQLEDLDITLKLDPKVGVRVHDSSGNPIPTSLEYAVQADKRAEQADQLASQMEQENQRLLQKIRELEGCS